MDNTQTAVFGMGCFWGAERLFWSLNGVSETAVGYAGGTTTNPSYKEVCSGTTHHAEVVIVKFDPAVIAYSELLSVFWENHDPTQGMRQGNDFGTQYRSTIYTTNCRGIPPEILGKEPRRLLRYSRHRGHLCIRCLRHRKFLELLNSAMNQTLHRSALPTNLR
jgi:methionine-S-sulfoxide reductase